MGELLLQALTCANQNSRFASKKLIYVGEASDSIGFRCFNPNTHELTTEYELLFDEDEVSRRHETLHAYDSRRELAVSGDYDQIPLIYRADHSATNESRKVYTTDLNPSRQRGSNSDGSTTDDIGSSISFKSVASINSIEIPPPTESRDTPTTAGSSMHVSFRSASDSGVKSKVINLSTSSFFKGDRISLSDCCQTPCTLPNTKTKHLTLHLVCHPLTVFLSRIKIVDDLPCQVKLSQRAAYKEHDQVLN